MRTEVGYTDPIEFNKVIKKVRSFFDYKGFVETHQQSRLSILAACEDPQNLSTFNYAGQVWPLPQTSQMHLEFDLMRNPSLPGMYSISTSYRNEAEPNPERHNLIFGLIDFEMKGGFDELINLEKEFCEWMGLGKANSYSEGDYLDIAKKYSTKELDHCHEEQLYKDYGPVYFLKNFPEFTSPFWNMARNNLVEGVDEENQTAKKCDVILSGVETIGSAERSCDPEVMKYRFETISNGDYAKTLYSQFGKERVDKEMSEFMKLPMIQRSGGGIGVTRLIRSLKKENLI